VDPRTQRERSDEEDATVLSFRGHRLRLAAKPPETYESTQQAKKELKELHARGSKEKGVEGQMESAVHRSGMGKILIQREGSSGKSDVARKGMGQSDYGASGRQGESVGKSGEYHRKATRKKTPSEWGEMGKGVKKEIRP